MRKLLLLGLVQVLFLLAGCGGNSGGGVITSTAGNTGNSGGHAANTVTMTVDNGPNGDAVDTPFITVTVCAPGSTTNCQQIDHVEVDTGSYGFRVMSSVLSPSLASALQQEQVSTNGDSIVECTQFADGFSWGPVKLADVQVAGESASNVPIQVMGDPTYTASSGTTSEIPTPCSSTGPEEDTVAAFGANGIIGIGPFGADCGSLCGTSVSGGTNPGWYYGCPASGWSPTNPCNEIAVTDSGQVTNPAVFFQTDNNGVIIEFPSAPEGASTLTGTLVFGIGTESNNSLGGQTVLTADSSYGDINTDYTTVNGPQQYLPYSYFDTGSNAYYFSDDGIPSLQGCSSYKGYNSTTPDSWFCPASELNRSAANTGQNGTQSTVYFSIGNAYTIFNSYAGTVFNDLGASAGSQLTDCASPTSASQDQSCGFDFGFPFFIGRNVYIAFAGANTAWGNGPYYAY
ncbi:MAG: DUF3443 family protein [Proteobacteria bacterium]|nr:DUF3443 family protein [Pseudomonadota bacterium]